MAPAPDRPARFFAPFFESRRRRVASATEGTGLMPALPQSEEEDENYASLYATHDQPPA